MAKKNLFAQKIDPLVIEAIEVVESIVILFDKGASVELDAVHPNKCVARSAGYRVGTGRGTDWRR